MSQGPAGGNYLLKEIALNWLSARESKEQPPLQITLFPVDTGGRPAGLGLRPRSRMGADACLQLVLRDALPSHALAFREDLFPTRAGQLSRKNFRILLCLPRLSPEDANHKIQAMDTSPELLGAGRW